KLDALTWWLFWSSGPPSIVPETLSWNPGLEKGLKGWGRSTATTPSRASGPVTGTPPPTTTGTEPLLAAWVASPEYTATPPPLSGLGKVPNQTAWPFFTCTGLLSCRCPDLSSRKNVTVPDSGATLVPVTTNPNGLRVAPDRVCRVAVTLN